MIIIPNSTNGKSNIIAFILVNLNLILTAICSKKCKI